METNFGWRVSSTKEKHQKDCLFNFHRILELAKMLFMLNIRKKERKKERKRESERAREREREREVIRKALLLLIHFLSHMYSSNNK
jgi:hypothetical protein